MDYTGMYSDSGKSSIKKTKPRQQGGGIERVGGNTFGLCACTGEMADMDVGVYASSTAQLHRKCKKRGQQVSEGTGATGTCGAPFFGDTGGGRELGGGNGNTVSDYHLPIYLNR